jgi:hypothetical protein
MTTGLDAQLGTSILFAVLGLSVVLLIEFAAGKGKGK